MAAMTANSKHIKIDVRFSTEENTYVRLFFSYNTCVGLQVGDQRPIFTSERYSATTNRHIRKLQYEHGGEFVTNDQLTRRVKQTGLGVKTSW